MTKNELINSVSSQTGINKQNISLVVEELMVVIKASVQNKESVTLRGFGSFDATLRHEKNFHYAPGKYKIIPEHYEPTFKPSKEFKELVK